MQMAQTVTLHFSVHFYFKKLQPSVNSVSRIEVYQHLGLQKKMNSMATT